MIEAKKKIDLVLYSSHIKDSLNKRIFEDLGLKLGDIVQDAKDIGYKGINKPNLSRYLNSTKPMSGSISHQTVFYLCLRYGIDIKIVVKSKDYDAAACIKFTKKVLNDYLEPNDS